MDSSNRAGGVRERLLLRVGSVHSGRPAGLCNAHVRSWRVLWPPDGISVVRGVLCARRLLTLKDGRPCDGDDVKTLDEKRDQHRLLDPRPKKHFACFCQNILWTRRGVCPRCWGVAKDVKR